MPLPGTVSYDEAVKLGHKAPESFDEWSEIDHSHNMMTWISKDFYKFIAKSRDIINDINRKYIGAGAIINQSDLAPLQKIMH